MRIHEILSHTADVRMRAESSTMKELFSAALEGMAEIQNAKRQVRSEKITRKIVITTADRTALLIDFLSEALAQSQIEKAVFSAVHVTKFSDTPSTSSGQAELEAEISGERVEGFGEDIKAVTYHGAEIVKNDAGNFEATILFDV